MSETGAYKLSSCRSGSASSVESSCVGGRKLGGVLDLGLGTGILDLGTFGCSSLADLLEDTLSSLLLSQRRPVS